MRRKWWRDRPGRKETTDGDRASGQCRSNSACASAAAALVAEAAELAAETAPRRFSVCALDFEAEDGAVLAWGIAFPERVVLCELAGRPAGTFVSADAYACGKFELNLHALQFQVVRPRR